jgi:hypothetical protein
MSITGEATPEETTDDESIIDKPASCESARYDPAAESATLESANNPTVIKHNTTEPLETLGQCICREG